MTRFLPSPTQPFLAPPSEVQLSEQQATGLEVFANFKNQVADAKIESLLPRRRDFLLTRAVHDLFAHHGQFAWQFGVQIMQSEEDVFRPFLESMAYSLLNLPKVFISCQINQSETTLAKNLAVTVLFLKTDFDNWEEVLSIFNLLLPNEGIDYHYHDLLLALIYRIKENVAERLPWQKVIDYYFFKKDLLDRIIVRLTNVEWVIPRELVLSAVADHKITKEQAILLLLKKATAKELKIIKELQKKIPQQTDFANICFRLVANLELDFHQNQTLADWQSYLETVFAVMDESSDFILPTWKDIPRPYQEAVRIYCLSEISKIRCAKTVLFILNLLLEERNKGTADWLLEKSATERRSQLGLSFLLAGVLIYQELGLETDLCLARLKVKITENGFELLNSNCVGFLLNRLNQTNRAKILRWCEELSPEETFIHPNTCFSLLASLNATKSLANLHLDYLALDRNIIDYVMRRCPFIKADFKKEFVYCYYQNWQKGSFFAENIAAFSKTNFAPLNPADLINNFLAKVNERIVTEQIIEITPFFTQFYGVKALVELGDQQTFDLLEETEMLYHKNLGWQQRNSSLFKIRELLYYRLHYPTGILLEKTLAEMS